MHTKRIFSLLLAALMLLSLAPLPARAAESALAYTCTGVQNSGAILSVNKAVTATLDAPELATLTQTGNTVTVTAKSGAVGVITVHLSAADETADVQIPLGYTTFRFQEDRLTVIPGSDSNYEISGINAAGEEYLEGDPTYPLPVQTDENGNRVYTNTDTYKICVNIKKKGGTYAFDGSSEDMSIAVKKEATGAAVLLLGDLSLRSSFTAPITVKKNSTTTVTLTALAGHTAVLEDAALNNADLYGDPADGGNGTNATYAESAVIKAKTDAKLTLNGAGTLKLVCNTKNAIKVGENGCLTVEEGSLSISSTGHGISSDNVMELRGGKITVTAADDAIRSNPDTVDAAAGTAGCITVIDGEYTLRAGSDGIQAAQDITIQGGTFDIQTGNGYQDKTSTDSRKGIKASNNNDESTDTSDSTNTIAISGGTFVLNTADDAVHSDGYIHVTGGTFRIRTGDDGMHADTSLTLGTEGDTGALPDVQVLESYEGLEAGNVYIYSGTYRVAASDDGINAAGGGSGDNFNPGGNPGRPGWPGGGGGSNTGDYNINISGGDIYVNVSSDGLDSNGNINLTGGKVVVFGNAAGRDGEPLDCDGTLTIKGATVFGAGSRQMVTTPGSSSQPYVCYSSSTVASGKTINVKYNGTTVYNIKAVKDINYVIYSSPEMTSTTGWTITFDDSAVIEPDDPCADGHTWDAGVTTAATCTQAGKTVYTCTVCNATQTQSIPALGHSYVTGYCIRCGAEDPNADWFTVTFVTENCTITVYETQDPAGAQQTPAQTAIARNAETGAKDLSGEGQVNFSVKPADGYTLQGVEITQGAENYKNLKVVDEAAMLYRLTKITGDIQVRVTAQKQETACPHSYTEETVKPTCTEPGYTRHTCTLCGDSYTDQETAALGHKGELRNAKQATCTEAGYTGDTVCTVCADMLATGTVLPALGHTWGQWQITVPATADSEGLQSRTCSVCGAQEEKVLPALGHNMIVDAAVEPTCTQTGLTEGAHCADCDYRIEQQVIPALGHDYQDGLCTRCGAEDPDFDRPCDGGDTCPGKVFADMPDAANWAHEGIDYCLENALMSGISDTQFAPKKTMTRAMLATVLYRLAGEPATTGTNPFTDVADGKYYANAVIWANQAGIVNGKSSTAFAPGDNVTRQELVSMISRFAQYVDQRQITASCDLSEFADASQVSGYAVNAMKWAVENGILAGRGEEIAPKETATRAEVAAILMRYCKLG